MLVCDTADFVGCVGLGDLDGEVVKVLVAGFADEINENEIVESFLAIDCDLLKIFVCWLDKIYDCESRALISSRINVSMHDHVAVSKVAYFKYWGN